MQTATLHKAFSIAAGVTAVAALALLQAGCENRHLLGAVEDDGAVPPGHDSGPMIIIGPDAGVDRPDAWPNIPDATPNLPDATPNLPDATPIPPTEFWTGYVENYTFPSGSDAVKLAFATDPAGRMVGTVTLGSGTAPPPPTDPNVGYPADLISQGGGPPDVDIASRRYVAEGYGYTMRAGMRTGDRLRFELNTFELWAGWCALQTPIPATGPCDEPVCASSCLPNRGTMVGPSGCGLWNPATSQYDPVDCGKLALCGFGGVCTCYPWGCMVMDGGAPYAFDITLITANRAIGSMSGRSVQLTKDP